VRSRTDRFDNVALSVMLALCTSCAYVPQQVEVRPQLRATTAIPVGGTKEVSVKVLDMRPSEIVGNRAIGADGIIGANVTTSGDVARVVETAISQELASQGFEIRDSARSTYGRQLRIEIVSLGYSVVPGIITGTLRSESAIHSECIDDKVLEYEQVHRGASEEKIFVYQFASENEAHINAAVSGAINALLADEELMNCIAGN
jgi:uncharacterized lipoprotein YajG